MENGGQRVGSGRKPHLQDKTKEQIMRYSASTILKALRDKSLDLKFRADLAKDFVIKTIPNKIEVDGQLRSAVIFVTDERAIKELGINLESSQTISEETPLFSN